MFVLALQKSALNLDYADSTRKEAQKAEANEKENQEGIGESTDPKISRPDQSENRLQLPT